jgi:hypothetical protein
MVSNHLSMTYAKLAKVAICPYRLLFLFYFSFALFLFDPISMVLGLETYQTNIHGHIQTFMHENYALNLKSNHVFVGSKFWNNGNSFYSLF